MRNKHALKQSLRNHLLSLDRLVDESLDKGHNVLRSELRRLGNVVASVIRNIHNGQKRARVVLEHSTDLGGHVSALAHVEDGHGVLDLIGDSAQRLDLLLLDLIGASALVHEEDQAGLGVDVVGLQVQVLHRVRQPGEAFGARGLYGLHSLGGHGHQVRVAHHERGNALDAQNLLQLGHRRIVVAQRQPRHRAVVLLVLVGIVIQRAEHHLEVLARGLESVVRLDQLGGELLAGSAPMGTVCERGKEFLREVETHVLALQSLKTHRGLVLLHVGSDELLHGGLLPGESILVRHNILLGIGIDHSLRGQHDKSGDGADSEDVGEVLSDLLILVINSQPRHRSVVLIEALLIRILAAEHNLESNSLLLQVKVHLTKNRSELAARSTPVSTTSSKVHSVRTRSKHLHTSHSEKQHRQVRSWKEGSHRK